MTFAPSLRELSYFAAITDGPATIRRVTNLIDAAGPYETDPLGRVLLTPVMLGKQSLAAFRELREARGTEIWFDSGGYYVQVGKLRYDELYYRLLQLYRQHDWADGYVLPDNVPTSADCANEVWRKVRETVYTSALFFEELPAHLRERAIPVVHGHTLEQVDFALSTYVRLGVRRVGFGSFGTFGANEGVNLAHAQSVAVARWVVRAAAEHGVSVHMFGLGVPALVAMIAGLGARSFDSSAWLKAAGFGQVTLPFSRAWNITYRNVGSKLQRGILWDDFQQRKAQTGHNCPYCEHHGALMGSKWVRAAHNLIALHESIAMINAGDHDRIHAIYASGSPKYREEAVRWLPNENR